MSAALLTDALAVQLHDEAEKAFRRAQIDAKAIGCSPEHVRSCAEAVLAETVRSFLAQAGILPPAVEDIRRVSLQPGDRLVVRSREPLDDLQVAHIERAMKRWAPDIPVAVLDGGLELAVVGAQQEVEVMVLGDGTVRVFATKAAAYRVHEQLGQPSMALRTLPVEGSE
jgi:hypothetical protein